MAATTHSVEVNAPLHTVYNQWTQFEEFPQFMEGIEEVRQEGEKRLFWRAKIGAKVKEWEAEITQQVPDERIAWSSTDGTLNAGTVTFEAVGPDQTRVTATIEYEPEGLLEKTGDAFGIPSGRVQGDLERFKEFIENRGQETGAWRGEIREDDIGSASSRAAAEAREQSQEQLPRAEAEPPAEGLTGSGQNAGDVVAEVPLSKEEVNVGKRTVGAGEVRLHKKITTEQVQVPVELKREDAVIERVNPGETMPSGSKQFQEEHIEVPLTQEEPVVEKTTQVTGGVRVRKAEGTEERTVQERVRREDVDIDESGKTSRKAPENN
ncbi:MAG: DUF2382 domain-containing protein [Verrucomicrobia bacterium]|nr:DUF2382 domain-containing protein [Verrucomicrobiota bacterium]